MQQGEMINPPYPGLSQVRFYSTGIPGTGQSISDMNFKDANSESSSAEGTVRTVFPESIREARDGGDSGNGQGSARGDISHGEKNGLHRVNIGMEWCHREIVLHA